MATTVSYSASMRTRKTNSASNAKSSAASQEYYENTYNYVGIVHFAGMALSGKVITGISLRVVAAQAGYGTGHTKNVYVRKSNYQSASQSGITGLRYCGPRLLRRRAGHIHRCVLWQHQHLHPQWRSAEQSGGLHRGGQQYHLSV